MSATNRGSKRRKGDAYYTPDDVARACVGALPEIGRHFTRVLEPHAGGGAFWRAVRDRWPSAWLYMVDADPHAPALGLYGAPGFVTVGDFVAEADASKGGTVGPLAGPWDLVVGNPPYNEAEVHVRMALDLRPKVAGFLLRLGFLEACKRSAFWREHPPSEVHVLTRRPSFTGGGTDASAYGFFVWADVGFGAPRLRWLDTCEGYGPEISP